MRREDKASASGARTPFTAVPHFLLRGECRFEEPIDFMVYMHLFTYSHGFGRRDAHMSQAQLERFTGATRNTIRKALDRLVRAKWIRCIEEFEYARMSRKWRVFLPEGESGPSLPDAGSKADPVKSESGTVSNEVSANLHPVTGSKTPPFKESSHKEISKNTLSPEMPESLRQYFLELKPARKRESEWRAYRELKADFSEADLADCLDWLAQNGIPGSYEPCHSPMAFLASGGVGRALACVQETRSRCEREVARAQEEASSKEEQKRLVNLEDAAAREREVAFNCAFPSENLQKEIIATYGSRFPTLAPEGDLLKNLAIASWWSEEGKQWWAGKGRQDS